MFMIIGTDERLGVDIASTGASVLGC